MDKNQITKLILEHFKNTEFERNPNEEEDHIQFGFGSWTGALRVISISTSEDEEHNQFCRDLGILPIQIGTEGGGGIDETNHHRNVSNFHFLELTEDIIKSLPVTVAEFDVYVANLDAGKLLNGIPPHTGIPDVNRRIAEKYRPDTTPLDHRLGSTEN
jgi:hypothetical protein